MGSNPTLSASLRQPACHSSEGTAGRGYGWRTILTIRLRLASQPNDKAAAGKPEY
ncbi:MAG: hypothetical protein ACETVS_01120 [Dehalococcoidales bacterium]